ncbi:MAG: chorismate synthase, partial [Candidatus Neomarinimicrobiota bacterium]
MLKRLQFLTAGESHGKGLLGILEGMPAGLPVSATEINVQLHRRQQGYGRGKRMQIEDDRIEIYAGVRYGKTLGSPIGLVLKNRDWDTWKKRMAVEPVDDPTQPVTLPRPGHADLPGAIKFGTKDIRNVLERASARETAMRVALGAVARKLLQEIGISIASRVVRIGPVQDPTPLPQPLDPEAVNRQADQSPVRCLEPQTEQAMLEVIRSAKEDGDSVGGVFEMVAAGIPPGLGSGVTWDRKLSARIGEALHSINAIKGVEIGLGFASAERRGSAVHDEILWQEGTFTRLTNNAGGLEGGMTNGMPLLVRAVMKPIPTLVKPLRSVDLITHEPRLAHKER